MRIDERKIRRAVRRSLNEVAGINVDKVMRDGGFSWNGTDSIGNEDMLRTMQSGEEEPDAELSYCARNIAREREELMALSESGYDVDEAIQHIDEALRCLSGDA